MTMNVQGVQNWGSLLRVGSNNPLHSAIERDLGPIVSPDPIGHDGQLYYLIARDPFASGGTVEALASFDNNPPRYRYRRILFPLLAGGFGQLGGKATLFGMMFLAALGLGLVAVAVADLAYQLRLSGGSVFLAFFNAGAFLSTMLLTADALALGLALVGATLTLRDRTAAAVVAFALAGLTKELYLLVPVSLAAWHWSERRRPLAIPLAVLPAMPLFLWSAWVRAVVPDVPTDTPNLGMPMVALAAAIPRWLRPGELDVVQRAVAIFVGASFATAIAMLIAGQSRPLRWILALWIAMACIAGSAVWSLPTNTARAFAIVWPVGMLLLMERLARLRGSVHRG